MAQATNQPKPSAAQTTKQPKLSMAQPDPDDIYRELDEENEDACAAEIARLKRKRKGLRSTF